LVVLAPNTGAVVIRDTESQHGLREQFSLLVGAEDHAGSAIAGDHTIVVSEPPQK
jgi:hypothetical protein